MLSQLSNQPNESPCPPTNPSRSQSQLFPLTGGPCPSAHAPLTNKFLVEIMSSPAYGSSKVGGTLISEWLQAGSASKTLFAGLFRPVATIERRVAEESRRLFPAEGQVRC